MPREPAGSFLCTLTRHLHTHARAHPHAHCVLAPQKSSQARYVFPTAWRKQTGCNMNEIYPERLLFPLRPRNPEPNRLEYVAKFDFVFRVSSYSSTISCGKLKL